MNEPVIVGGRPYRASNFRYNRDGKTADVDGYYGPIAKWRRVGCKIKIAMVLEQAWQEPIIYLPEEDGQLALF